MTDSADKHPPEGEKHAPPASTPSATEKTFVRLTLWQTLLSVVGIFIAIVALYAALTESAAVRHQTAAAVWPFVQMSIEDHDSESAAMFRISFTNVGVGPARLRELRLLIAGNPVRSWEEAVTEVGGSTSAEVSRNFLHGRVLSPEQSITLIGTHDTDLARRFQAAINAPGTFLSYCYCSIFDDCWLADSRKDLQNPDPVEHCPDFGEDAYRSAGG